MMRLMRSLSVAALTIAGVFASAQEIYEGNRALESQGITLQGWGSGSIAQTDEMGFEAPSSLRISSRNFFQGGIIRFTKPIDLSGPYPDKSNLLRFTLNVPTVGGSTPAAGGGRGGAAGAGGGRAGGAGGVAGGGRGGDGGNVGNPGEEGPSTGGGQVSAGQQFKPLTKIRLIFTTTDGKHGEAYVDVTTAVKNEAGWFTVGLPLQTIRGLENSNKQLASVSLSGDSVSTFYVGDISVVRDSTPVFGEPNVRELNLAFGDSVTFTATGYGGVTPVRFLWDFDASDGIQIDAEGASVTRRFRREGTFTVTLTVVDMYGLKQPYSTTIQVTVNP